MGIAAQLKNIHYLWPLGLLAYISYSPQLLAEPSANTPEPANSSYPNYGEHLIEMMLSLLLVLAIIFALAWLFKRLNNTRLTPNKVMDVKACLPLSPKEKLMIVQLGEEQVVIGVAPGFVGLVKSLDKPLIHSAKPGELVASGSSFAKTLEMLVKGKSLASDNTKNREGHD